MHSRNTLQSKTFLPNMVALVFLWDKHPKNSCFGIWFDTTMPWTKGFTAREITTGRLVDFVPRKACNARVLMALHRASFAPFAMLGVIRNVY